MSFFTLLSEGIFTSVKSTSMSIIYVLLTISVIVALVFFFAFIRSVRSGQYDDVYTPSVRMLFEDEVIKKENNSTNTQKEKH